MDFDRWIIAQQASKDLLMRKKQQSEERIQSLQANLEDTIQARDFVSEVGKFTQEQLSKYIQSIISFTLRWVYGDQYDFEMEYEIKRNEPVCNLWLIKDGKRRDPKDEMGGGVLDIISFAMKLAMWSLQENRKAPVFWWDEPFKFIHGDDLERNTGEMVKGISEKLGAQIIMISEGKPGIEEFADCVYRVWQNPESGISQIIKE